VCLRPTLPKLSSTHTTSWRLFIIGMRSATTLVEHPALPTVLKVSMILSMANSVEAVTCRILNLQVRDQANAFLPKSLTAPLLSLRCTAFDPIFYLHHSNVDRMISLWQALNYNTWVSPGLSSRGTWRTRANAPDGQQYRYNERDTCVLTNFIYIYLSARRPHTILELPCRVLHLERQPFVTGRSSDMTIWSLPGLIAVIRLL